MTLFAKKIKTTADHHAAFKKAITDAIKAAIKAGVPLGLIHGEFENRAADFRRAEESRAEARRADPMPQMFDAETYLPIDAHGQAARAEERRMAEELRRQQAEYRAVVNRRAEREDFLRR